MPLNEQAKAFLQDLADQNAPPIETLPPKQGRRLFAALNRWFGENPEIDSVQQYTFPTGFGGRIYRSLGRESESGKPQPVIIYFHGGGWVLGDLETHDALCRRLAIESSCTVIAIDYALSPESRYPVALDQCYDAITHVVDHATDFNVMPNRVAVAGDSAGGNLAAAVALRSRDAGGPYIDLQVLIYPVLQHDFNQPSYLEYAEGFGLSRERMQWFWKQYLGSQPLDCYAAPGHATHLHALPETLLITAEYDVLRSEGESFAQKLITAGIPVTCRRYEGNLHGFIHFSGIFDDGRSGATYVAQFCKQHLHR